MRRLMLLFAAVGTALVFLAGGIALAQPSYNGGAALPPERGVDRDPQGNPYVAGELVVIYEERTSARAADEANEEASADVEVGLPEIDAAVLSFPEVKAKIDRGSRQEALKNKKKELEKDPNVESVSYNYLLQAQSNDELYSYQWGLPKIKAPAAWTITRGAKARIAVVDSGIQDNHPDLTGGVTFEHDYVQDDAVAEPTDLHATHVAGIVAARTDNGTGMAGTAPRAQLMDYKVVGPNGASFGDASQAIIDAAKAGAGVINISIGGPTGAPVLENAVNFAWNRGAVVVASAGNDFENGNPLNYPAAYPKVVAVGAVNKADTRSNFSNVHPYVDVAAPGGSTVFGTPPENKILSSVPVSFTPGCGGNPNCYDFYAGTSQAAAFVSGVAALLDSRGLTNTQIRRRIEGTATDLGPAGKDNQYGHGLVNARAAVGR